MGHQIASLFQGLRSQKLRTLLTAFGIVWGTVAISLLLAFGEGIHRKQISSFAGLGDRIVIAWPARTTRPFAGFGRGRPIRMTQEDVDFLRDQIPSLASISCEFTSQLRASVDSQVRMVSISGVEPDYGAMRNMVPQAGGRFLNPLDMDRRRRVVFVGNQIAEDLFGAEEPVGQEILLHGSPFLVVGVLREKDQDSSYSGRDHSKMMIPATTFQAMTGQKYMNNFVYRASTPGENEALTRRITASLGRRMKFDPSDEQAVMVWDTTEMFVFFDTFMLAFKIFLGIMGVLTLVVGGIGVSNIMNVVVEERTREIGIKMALGARRGWVLRQFLLETMLLTVVGGAVGLGLSVGICRVFPRLGLYEYVGTPVLSPGLTLLTALVLGLVGLLAGYFPARDASRLDPVVAMKL